MDSKTSSRETLLLLAAAVVVIFIYMGSLSGPFVFDDEPNITENRHIRLTHLSPEGIYAAAFNSPLPQRPVANASFALNYFFNGYNVVGYRFVNILIHIINGYLVYLLARFTLRTPALRSYREQAGAIACGTAILWLVHPLHTQSVAYIVQRMTSLTTLFYLLAMVCYADARFSTTATRKHMLLALCTVSGLLALGTKEIAATLPLFIFLYEWFFFQELKRDWLRRRLPTLAGVCVAFGVIVLIFSGFENPIERIFAPYAGGGLTAWQRVMTQFRVVVFYLSLLFWPAPSRLNLDHDVAVSLALFDPATTLISLLFLAGLFATAVLTARREPLASYAILWFLGNLVIESSVIRLELIFDHRTYLPSVFPAMVLVSLVFRFLKQKWAALALLAALAAGCSFWTWQRSLVWADEVALWRDCLEKSPLKPRPYNNLGSALSKIGRFEEAAALPRPGRRAEAGLRRCPVQSGLCAGAAGAGGRRDPGTPRSGPAGATQLHGAQQPRRRLSHPGKLPGRRSAPAGGLAPQPRFRSRPQQPRSRPEKPGRPRRRRPPVLGGHPGQPELRRGLEQPRRIAEGTRPAEGG